MLLLKNIEDIPKKILAKDFPEEIDIRGEVFIQNSDFENIKKKFANPRNAASGTLRQKNPEDTKKIPLKFIAYTFGFASGLKIKNQFDYGSSITLDNPSIALQNSFPKNNYYMNPFFSENNGLGLNQKMYLMGNDLFISYSNSKINPLTNINNDTILPLETLALSLNLNNRLFERLSLTTGLMKEGNSFLLSKSSGAFEFENENIIQSLKYLKGLKYFLSGFNRSQLDIKNFISKCKESEDKDGYISNNFIKLCIDAKYKFTSGPFIEIIFKIIELQRNSMKILLGNFETTIKKKEYFFTRV